MRLFLTFFSICALTSFAAAASVNIVQNSNFSSGTLNNWTNWTFAATGGLTSFTAFTGYPGPTLQQDNTGTLSITQSNLTGLKTGPGAFGAGQVIISMGWNPCSLPASVAVSVAGVTYATFTTIASGNSGTSGYVGTVSYTNGASGTAASGLPSSPYTTWTTYPWTINLPASVANTGALKVLFNVPTTGCVADVTVTNVQLLAQPAPNLTIAKTYTASPTPVVLGEVVTYTYVVTNTGNVAMTNVQVKDMHGSPATQVPLGAGGITSETLTAAGFGGSTDATPNNGIWDNLAPGASVTFTWAHTVTQAEIDHG